MKRRDAVLGMLSGALAALWPWAAAKAEPPSTLPVETPPPAERRAFLDGRDLEEYWGWREMWWGGPRYSVPLEPTMRFPLTVRRVGVLGFQGVVHPPYLVADCVLGGDEAVEVSIYDGGGMRAGLSDNNTTENCVYVGADNMPPAWREAVTAALAEVRRAFPGKRILATRDEVEGYTPHLRDQLDGRQGVLAGTAKGSYRAMRKGTR